MRKSEFLLNLIDAISKCFGVKRISLIEYSKNIDLSLYMIMKYQKTFYEKYGYRFCDTPS